MVEDNNDAFIEFLKLFPRQPRYEVTIFYGNQGHLLPVEEVRLFKEMSDEVSKLNLKNIHLYKMGMNLKAYRRFKFKTMSVDPEECNVMNKIKKNLLISNLGSFLNIRFT